MHEHRWAQKLTLLPHSGVFFDPTKLQRLVVDYHKFSNKGTGRRSKDFSRVWVCFCRAKGNWGKKRTHFAEYRRFVHHVVIKLNFFLVRHISDTLNRQFTKKAKNIFNSWHVQRKNTLNEATWCYCEHTCLSLEFSNSWPWPGWPMTLTHVTFDLEGQTHHQPHSGWSSVLAWHIRC